MLVFFLLSGKQGVRRRGKHRDDPVEGGGTLFEAHSFYPCQGGRRNPQAEAHLQLESGEIM